MRNCIRNHTLTVKHSVLHNLFRKQSFQMYALQDFVFIFVFDEYILPQNMSFKHRF